MFCPKCGAQNPDTGRFCRSCGTDLGVVSKALKGESDNVFGLSNDSWLGNSSDHSFDNSGRKKSPHANNPDEIMSSGIRQAIVGIGFFVVSMVLFFTNVANGQKWWWALLFPAFTTFASGIGSIVKARRMEQKLTARMAAPQQVQLPNAQSNANLPPAQTNFVTPDISYKTGDLVPPSVVENTTRHLETDSEGETMTLPKK